MGQRHAIQRIGAEDRPGLNAILRPVCQIQIALVNQAQNHYCRDQLRRGCRLIDLLQCRRPAIVVVAAAIPSLYREREIDLGISLRKRSAHSCLQRFESAGGTSRRSRRHAVLILADPASAVPAATGHQDTHQWCQTPEAAPREAPLTTLNLSLCLIEIHGSEIPDCKEHMMLQNGCFVLHLVRKIQRNTYSYVDDSFMSCAKTMQMTITATAVERPRVSSYHITCRSPTVR